MMSFSESSAHCNNVDVCVAHNMQQTLMRMRSEACLQKQTKTNENEKLLLDYIITLLLLLYYTIIDIVLCSHCIRI